MAQFAVHKNMNARARATYPLLLDIQSDLLSDLRTRVVVPLTRQAALLRKPVTHLTPLITVEGVSYLLLTPQLAGIAVVDVGELVADVSDQRETIIAALDFLVSGF
jgi:toxin CcdB